MVAQISRMTESSIFQDLEASNEINRLAVMMSMCFPLSKRNVDDLLHDPGIGIADEAFTSCIKNAETRFTSRDGSTPVPFPPPLAHREPETRP